MSNSNVIAHLNDKLRTTLTGGQLLITSGVKSLPLEVQFWAIKAMTTFKDFNEDNDPHGEHDFGKVEVHITDNDVHEKFFWKIDYYDKSLKNGSEDPANPFLTTRVLTLMLAREY